MSTSARVSATGSARTSGVSGFSMAAHGTVSGIRSEPVSGREREVTVTSQPAWGIGLATSPPTSQVLDTWYPTGKLGLGELPLVAGERPGGRCSTCRRARSATGRCPACVPSRWSP